MSWSLSRDTMYEALGRLLTTKRQKNAAGLRLVIAQVESSVPTLPFPLMEFGSGPSLCLLWTAVWTVTLVSMTATVLRLESARVGRTIGRNFGVSMAAGCSHIWNLCRVGS